MAETEVPKLVSPRFNVNTDNKTTITLSEAASRNIEYFFEITEKAEKYDILFEFVKRITKRRCCNVCKCMPCDALDILRKVKE